MAPPTGVARRVINVAPGSGSWAVTATAGTPAGGDWDSSWRAAGTSSPAGVRPPGSSPPERSSTRARARRPATVPRLSASAPRSAMDASSSARARSRLPPHSASTPNSWWKYASSATSPVSRAASEPIRSARSQAVQCSPAAKAGAELRASLTAVAGCSDAAPGTSALIAASTASASAAARSGVTEGCPVHQA